MKILIYSSCHIAGGSEKIASTLAKILSTVPNYSVEFVTGYTDKLFKEIKTRWNANQKKLPLIITNRQTKVVWKLAYKIFEVSRIPLIFNYLLFLCFLRKNKFDRIIINAGGIPAAPTNLALALAIKTLRLDNSSIFICHGIPNEKKKLRELENFNFVTHSRHNLELLQNIGYLNVSCFPSYHFIEEKKLPKGEKDSNLQYDLLSVGFLEERKGHLEFLKQFKELIWENNLTYAIIGSGPMHNSLLTYIHKNKLENNVFLLGPKDQYVEYVKNCKIFIHSSIGSEDMPLVVIEAMQLGKMIFATPVAGIKNYLANTDAAILFELIEKKETTENILTALHNDEIRKQYGQKAQKCYISLFTKEKYTENWKRLIEQQ